MPVNNNQLEIDSLSNAFNTMLKDIEISFEKEKYMKEKMQRFISDASHELRTPLTSIHGFLEVLLRGAAKNENQLNLALNSILNESERLTLLVNELLILTKLDQQNTAVELKKENLSEIVRETYPQLAVLAGDRKIEVYSIAVLQVTDNGSGIPEKDLNEIFDRFFRSEAHRSRKHGGYGLGLSIVKSIIDSHSGEINVSSECGKGTTFSVYLKLAE